MINSYENLYNVMNIQTASYDSIYMERFIRRRIKKLGLSYTTDDYGNIYVTKGKADLYPTMVCHIDTVHEVNLNVKVFRTDNKLFAFDTKEMQQYGIGGDDKVGIYITLQLLQQFENFKAVFFKDEEVGCIGSGQANYDFFNDSTIVLQCDRKGNTDFVNEIMSYEMYGEDLQQIIAPILKHYKRKETSGGLTDVLSIAKNNEVQVANMSCGYYNPHCADEYISINDVFTTAILCYQILKATKDKRYTIKRKTPVYPKYNYTRQYVPAQYNHFDFDTPEKADTYDGWCAKCGNITIFDDLESAYYCNACNGYTMYYDNNYEYSEL